MSVALAALTWFLPTSTRRDWILLFWCEAAAVVAFGVSLFVKGGGVIGD